MSYYNSLQQKIDSQTRDELSNTANVLETFADLVHSREYAFSRNVVLAFYRKLDIGQLTQRFHDYASNDVYFDFIDCAVKNAISARSKKGEHSTDDWGDCLIESIESCWHLYSLDKSLENIEVYKKIDMFCSSMLDVCNKLETIAYNIMEARINEKTYREELFEPIDCVYSDFYYFLVKLGSDASFPKLDASCRLFSKDDNNDAK